MSDSGDELVKAAAGLPLLYSFSAISEWCFVFNRYPHRYRIDK